MKTSIIIRKTSAGFTIIRHKTGGLQKGYTTIANICGGAMGRILVIQTAKTASLICMADEVVFEADDGIITRGEQEIVDAIAAFEIYESAGE